MFDFSIDKQTFAVYYIDTRNKRSRYYSHITRGIIMSEKNYKQMNRKKVIRRKIKVFFILPILLVVLAGTIYCGGVLSNAHGNLAEEPVGFKYYKSIEIKQGDTLWEIANKYMTDEYNSPQEYIDEIKELNGLTSNNIQESKHLLIAFYDTAFKE